MAAKILLFGLICFLINASFSSQINIFYEKYKSIIVQLDLEFIFLATCIFMTLGFTDVQLAAVQEASLVSNRDEDGIPLLLL